MKKILMLFLAISMAFTFSLISCKKDKPYFCYNTPGELLAEFCMFEYYLMERKEKVDKKLYGTMILKGNEISQALLENDQEVLEIHVNFLHQYCPVTSIGFVHKLAEEYGVKISVK